MVRNPADLPQITAVLELVDEKTDQLAAAHGIPRLRQSAAAR